MSYSRGPRIAFDEVGVRYGRQQVIASLSREIDPGSLVVLLGPSGSGKTTLLRAVNRMVEISAGSILIDGVDVRDQDPVRLRRSIGYVMQASGLFPHRTVADNVTTVPRLNGMPRSAARGLAASLLPRVGLDAALGGRYPGQLSGGQQQRVGVARAIAAEPRLLLMDEPFAAVDPITRRALQRETLRLHRETGATILFVTHDVDEALALADRIIVLSPGGQIAQDDIPARLLSAPASDFVAELLGTDGDRRLTVQSLADAEIVVDAAGRPIGLLDR